MHCSEGGGAWRRPAGRPHQAGRGAGAGAPGARGALRLGVLSASAAPRPWSGGGGARRRPAARAPGRLGHGNGNTR